MGAPLNRVHVVAHVYAQNGQCTYKCRGVRAHVLRPKNHLCMLMQYGGGTYLLSTPLQPITLSQCRNARTNPHKRLIMPHHSNRRDGEEVITTKPSRLEILFVEMLGLMVRLIVNMHISPLNIRQALKLELQVLSHVMRLLQ